MRILSEASKRNHSEGKLLLILQVDLNRKVLGENLYLVAAEIGGPQWQFADRYYAMNKNGTYSMISKASFIHTKRTYECFVWMGNVF